MIFWTIDLLICLLLAFLIKMLVWNFRPNQARVVDDLKMETSLIVRNGFHNAFTDLVYWKNAFYLVYICSPSHFANRKSCVVVLCSNDFKEWKEIVRLDAEGRDIRDPKIVCINDHLFIYALLNDSLDPKPNTTVYSFSANGLNWSTFQTIDQTGWLFGRPKTWDEKIWYVAAHKWTFDQVALLRSEDGVDWQTVSVIADQKGLDETAIELINDMQMIAVTRFEVGGIFGSKKDGTRIFNSVFPFEKWNSDQENQSVRLDSPNLFLHDKRIFAVGRFQPPGKGLFGLQGSVFACRRTALYFIYSGKVIHLSDLPSSGDTAYAGVVTKGNTLFISYYSSPIEKEYPWILGMMTSTGIYTTTLDLDLLSKLAEERSNL